MCFGVWPSVGITPFPTTLPRLDRPPPDLPPPDRPPPDRPKFREPRTLYPKPLFFRKKTKTGYPQEREEKERKWRREREKSAKFWAVRRIGCLRGGLRAPPFNPPPFPLNGRDRFWPIQFWPVHFGPSCFKLWRKFGPPAHRCPTLHGSIFLGSLPPSPLALRGPPPSVPHQPGPPPPEPAPNPTLKTKRWCWPNFSWPKLVRPCWGGGGRCSGRSTAFGKPGPRRANSTQASGFIRVGPIRLGPIRLRPIGLSSTCAKQNLMEILFDLGKCFDFGRSWQRNSNENKENNTRETAPKLSRSRSLPQTVTLVARWHTISMNRPRRPHEPWDSDEFLSCVRHCSSSPPLQPFHH